MMSARAAMPAALTVAGSDSGGGAGIQADLKTFHALGVFGTSAITAITCQNPARVSAVQAIAPRIVAGQISRVFEAFPVRAAKTGMLYDATIIETVAGAFRARRFRNLVVDPVMVASSGALLLKRDAITALTTQLMPQATVVTPNLAEAEVLLRHHIRSLANLRAGASALAGRYGVPFLVKGGHLRGARRAVDVLSDGTTVCEFSAPLVPRIKTHGTGCTFSAAIAAYLALGHVLPEAIDRAKVFVTKAIRQAVRLGRYRALRV
jgi:hydroxymethylpyrimidine/phosphomethylpyrimidine kinase